MNYKYANIKHQRVLDIVDTPMPVPPANVDDAEWIEITKTVPLPKIGWKYDRMVGVFSPATEEEINFQAAKEAAVKSIDEAAGNVRTKFITNIPGQEEVYREKYEQAIDFLSSSTQVRYTDFPMLELERQILDVPMKDIAENVIKRRSEWMTKMCAVESLRLSGKYNLQACTTINEVHKLKAHIIHKLNEVC